MPVARGRDGQGAYYSWGPGGHRYHYQAGHAPSRDRAKELAARQGRAIKASQGRAAARRALGV
jgi:hypothetical protein